MKLMYFVDSASEIFLRECFLFADGKHFLEAIERQ